MVMGYTPRQGDIIFLNFSPQAGHEQAGDRPAVIVSNDDFYELTGMAMVCPITNTDNRFPLHIPLSKDMKTTGVILCEHVKSLDIFSRQARFKERLPEALLKQVISYVHACL